MGGQSSKAKAPTNAFLGADGRPYYEPDPDEERTRCCCVYLARGVLKLMLAVVFVCILGLGAAALIGGPNKNMTHYTNDNPAAEDQLTFYRIQTGYIRYESQAAALASPTVDSVKHDLKSIDKALWIMGIVTAGVTGLSCLFSMWMIISVIFEQVKRGCVCCFLPFAVLQVGAAVAYYVLAAVYISQHVGQRISTHTVPRPDWAWYLIIFAGVGYLVASVLTILMPRPTKHVPTTYLQQDAARARGWSLASQAPQDPEAARLPSGPSSAPVNAPVLEYHPAASKGSSKGWFGKGKSGKGQSQGFESRSATQIADRYRPRGSSAPSAPDVEMPNSYWNRR